MNTKTATKATWASRPVRLKKLALKPPALDFFAGSGLAAEGLRPFFSVIWANDICEKKAPTYRANHPPKAVFCGNDILAFGAMAAVKEAGYRVGIDVSIVGFDDLEASEVTDPPLTTVRIPAYKMGRMGAETLIDLIAGKIEEPLQYVLETAPIIRESTGNPGGSFRHENAIFHEGMR